MTADRSVNRDADMRSNWIDYTLTYSNPSTGATGCTAGASIYTPLGPYIYSVSQDKPYFGTLGWPVLGEDGTNFMNGVTVPGGVDVTIFAEILDGSGAGISAGQVLLFYLVDASKVFTDRAVGHRRLPRRHELRAADHDQGGRRPVARDHPLRRRREHLVLHRRGRRPGELRPRPRAVGRRLPVLPAGSRRLRDHPQPAGDRRERERRERDPDLDGADHERHAQRRRVRRPGRLQDLPQPQRRDGLAAPLRGHRQRPGRDDLHRCGGLQPQHPALRLPRHRLRPLLADAERERAFEHLHRARGEQLQQHAGPADSRRDVERRRRQRDADLDGADHERVPLHRPVDRPRGLPDLAPEGDAQRSRALGPPRYGHQRGHVELHRLRADLDRHQEQHLPLLRQGVRQLLDGEPQRRVQHLHREREQQPLHLDPRPAHVAHRQRVRRRRDPGLAGADAEHRRHGLRRRRRVPRRAVGQRGEHLAGDRQHGLRDTLVRRHERGAARGHRFRRLPVPGHRLRQLHDSEHEPALQRLHRGLRRRLRECPEPAHHSRRRRRFLLVRVRGDAQVERADA